MQTFLQLQTDDGEGLDKNVEYFKKQPTRQTPLFHLLVRWIALEFRIIDVSTTKLNENQTVERVSEFNSSNPSTLSQPSNLPSFHPLQLQLKLQLQPIIQCYLPCIHFQ